MCPGRQSPVSYIYLVPAYSGRLAHLRQLIAVEDWAALDVAAREFAARVSDVTGLLCAIHLLADVRQNLPKDDNGSDGESVLRLAAVSAPPFSYDR